LSYRRVKGDPRHADEAPRGGSAGGARAGQGTHAACGFVARTHTIWLRSISGSAACMRSAICALIPR